MATSYTLYVMSNSPYSDKIRMYLRLKRLGGTVTASSSHDGKAWKEQRTFQVGLAKKLHVGVVALQNTPAAFEAVFEDFTVTPAKAPASEPERLPPPRPVSRPSP